MMKKLSVTLPGLGFQPRDSCCSFHKGHCGWWIQLCYERFLSCLLAHLLVDRLNNKNNIYYSLYMLDLFESALHPPHNRTTIRTGHPLPPLNPVTTIHPASLTVLQFISTWWKWRDRWQYGRVNTPPSSGMLANGIQYLLDVNLDDLRY